MQFKISYDFSLINESRTSPRDGMAGSLNICSTTISSSWNPNQDNLVTHSNRPHYKKIEKHTLERIRGGEKPLPSSYDVLPLPCTSIF